MFKLLNSVIIHCWVRFSKSCLCSMWLIFIFIDIQYAFQSFFWNILLFFLIIMNYETYWVSGSAQLDYPSDFFFPPFVIVSYMVFQWVLFKTPCCFLKYYSKTGLIVSSGYKGVGCRNLVFIRFYLLSQIYLFQEFIPFWFFFGFALLFLHSRVGMSIFWIFFIEKINYTFILLLLENNFLNCSFALIFLTF